MRYGESLRGVQMSEVSDSQVKKEKKESIGSYIGNLILCMLFPFVALWFGPKYLIKGEVVKGVVIIAVVAVELYFVFTLTG